MARTLIGPVSPAHSGTGIADGALLSAPGCVYVGYQGNTYPFKAMSQLTEDGYSGTAAVEVPGTVGLSLVFPYSGVIAKGSIYSRLALAHPAAVPESHPAVPRLASWPG